MVSGSTFELLQAQACDSANDLMQCVAQHPDPSLAPTVVQLAMAYSRSKAAQAGGEDGLVTEVLKVAPPSLPTSSIPYS